MILPTKHMQLNRCLLGIGADILRLLNESKTVSRLWEDLKTDRSSRNVADVPFDWFVLSLDFLYMLGAIDRERGRVERAAK